MRNFYKFTLCALTALSGYAYSNAANSTNTRAEADWEDYCYGYFCDFILSDLHDTNYQSMEVIFQRNVSDPTTFRILEPYKNWDNTAYAEYYTYIPENATPFVFHIVGDGEYMWWEKFNTGFIVNMPLPNGETLRGMVTCEMTAEDGIAILGLANLIKWYPEALAYVLYDEYGTQIGMYKDFNMDGPQPTAIVSFGANRAAVNQSETFFILMQDAEEGGVEGVIEDQDNVPAEYFNLQGVKVANPEKGQLVIERKGNKSTTKLF